MKWVAQLVAAAAVLTSPLSASAQSLTEAQARTVIAPWYGLFNQPVQGDMKTLQEQILTADYESCWGYLPGECWGRDASIKVEWWAVKDSNLPSRRSSHLAAYDDAIPGDENFLDLELHVGDGLGKASDHFDRGITAPAFAGQIARARLVVRGEDLLLERLHIALDGLVEQAVPGGDHGARLDLGQTLCRGGKESGQDGDDGDELSEPLHGVPPGSESLKLLPNMGRPLLDSACEASS